MSPFARRRDEPRFDFSAGSLCLDFANTWSERARVETDKLRDASDLVSFGRQAGVFTSNDTSRLLDDVETSAKRSAAVFERSLGLREAVYGLFSALAAGTEPSDTDLGRINEEVREALRSRRVRRRQSSFVWAWDGKGATLASLLQRVAYSGAELLTGPDLDRVRECDGNTCTWLFLDGSRNRSRRWCDMSSCGNRAKQRRHHARQSQT